MHNYSSMPTPSQGVGRQLVLPGLVEPLPVPYYIPLPHNLLSELRNAPAAIGAYAIIARQFRLSRGAPVYLSTNDLMAYDPLLTIGSARRAFQSLLRKGYISIAETHGSKRGYVPTWGTISGAARPWKLSEPILNRPPHIRVHKLDQRFLDTCLGRLEPSRQFAAKIERYIETPFLGLREIGEYALNATGYFVSSPRLEELGLLSGHRVRPLPDDTTILAYASQHENLTSLGWGHSIFSDEIRALRSPQVADTNSHALFFVPPSMIAGRIENVIAGVITGVIADDQEGQSAGEAPECPGEPIESQQAGSHEFMNQEEGDEDKDPPPTRASAPPEQQGGDTLSPNRINRTKGRTAPQGAPQPDETPLPDTDAVKLLQALGVMPSSIRLYMNDPLENVRAATDYASNYPGGRDPAALAVQALRDMRHGWKPPVRPSRHPNQIAPRRDGAEVWERPEHDYLELAAEIMPDWALANPFPGDVKCLAGILVELSGDDRAALEQFAEENRKRSGWRKEASCA